MIPAAEAQSPNHWITREFLNIQPFGGKEAGTCRILVPQQGVKPAPPALEAWSLNPWTTRDILEASLIFKKSLHL